MENPYQSYFGALPGYVTVQNREFRVIDANQQFREHFGDFEGRYCYQVYKHRAEVCETCPVARTFDDGECHHSEEQVRTLNGREISVIVYTTPIRNEAGEITAVLETSTDITEIKRMERRLRESQERYHTLFEEVPCYLSIQDRDLRLVDANRSFREDFGEGLGRMCYEVFKHRTKACVPCPVLQTFQDGQLREREEVVVAEDGKRVNVLVCTRPIRDSKGEITQVMEMATNITQIRELQSQLASLGLLIGSISHGIKGLLTGMDGGIYLVNSALESNDQDRLRKGWEMVRRNVRRIKSMVMDILYYAKGRELTWEPISAPELLDDVWQFMEPKLKENGIEFRREDSEADGKFEGDVKALRSLLIDLMANSLDACRGDKKKDKHHISIGFRGDQDHVLFEVADNGIGMDREARDKVFTLFFSSKGLEGTGLGLFIANKVAQAHGGSISMESEPGAGARFVVKLPRKPPLARRTQPAIEAPESRPTPVD